MAFSKSLSDNRNRTAANVRSIFSKAGGNLDAEGSVAYLFTDKVRSGSTPVRRGF